LRRRSQPRLGRLAIRHPLSIAVSYTRPTVVYSRTYAIGRFGGAPRGYPGPPRNSFLAVVGGFAAHDRQKKDGCGEGATFPTPLCVSPILGYRDASFRSQSIDPAQGIPISG